MGSAADEAARLRGAEVVEVVEAGAGPDPWVVPAPKAGEKGQDRGSQAQGRDNKNYDSSAQGQWQRQQQLQLQHHGSK